jgi:hypothetical protein
MKAFPGKDSIIDGEYGIQRWVQNSGMDLRDYFAAKAMQAVIINSDRKSTEIQEIVDWIGDYGYTVADAMIKAREQ